MRVRPLPGGIRPAYRRENFISPAAVAPPPREYTVAELLLAFLRHADGHYRRPDGTPTNEVVEFRLAARAVRVGYAFLPATEVGPASLRAVRQRLVEEGLSRTVVNARVNRIRRMFKWAAGEERIPFATYQSLTAVAGLQKGRTVVREPDPVGPVPEADLAATLPHLSPLSGRWPRSSG